MWGLVIRADVRGAGVVVSGDDFLGTSVVRLYQYMDDIDREVLYHITIIVRINIPTSIGIQFVSLFK